MSMPAPTMNDDGLKKSLITSAVVHVIALLFLYFGLPRPMPPLPTPHEPVSFQIVEISDLTNTRVKDEEPKPEPPKPEPPPPQPKVEQQPTPPPPKPMEPVKPEPQVEALKTAPVPKPKPPEPAKPMTDDFNKLLKNLESKKVETPKVTESKPDSKAAPQPAVSQATSLSQRLTISEEDALRRQIEHCWHPDPGARDVKDLVVELTLDVNPDRTVLNAEVVDKSRYASDPYFRAFAESALRAVRNPQCSPLELPADKYDQWKRTYFTFDPRDLI